MTADGAWERKVQGAIDHAGALRGMLLDVVGEWRARQDDEASRARIAEVLTRARARGAKLRTALEEIAA